MSTPPERSLEQRLRELTVTNELIKTLTSTLELPEVLRMVLDRIKVLTRAEALSLLLYDGERDELVFAATETLQENTVAGLRVPPEQGIASWVAHTGESALVNDVANDRRFYGGIDRASRFATHSLLAVPLRRAGRVIGVIEVANRYDSISFSTADLEKLEVLAASVGDSIDPERLSHDADAMRQLLASVVAAVPGEASSLLLYDPEGRELVFTASRTLQSGAIDGIRMRCDQGIAGWVARHREAVRLDDACPSSWRAGRWRCWCSTWTISRRSSTRTATSSAAAPSLTLAGSSATSSVRATLPHASVGTSSSSSSPTPTLTRRVPSPRRFVPPSRP